VSGGHTSEESYWARGISRERVELAIRHSLCYAAFDADGGQVAFARVVTDRATFAYLCDVFVVQAQRGRGIGRRLVRFAMEDPRLGRLRRWVLATRDAHGVYAGLGFRAVGDPSKYMEIVDAASYSVP
jgi:GNAT superfamily N-acetyltransferase